MYTQYAYTLPSLRYPILSYPILSYSPQLTLIHPRTYNVSQHYLNTIQRITLLYIKERKKRKKKNRKKINLKSVPIRSKQNPFDPSHLTSPSLPYLSFPIFPYLPHGPFSLCLIRSHLSIHLIHPSIYK